ncbi:MAG: preprotein translocase subunit SecG [Treponema sp.]|nr:preprotein translocase subunit SecG [Treponema sp.]
MGIVGNILLVAFVIVCVLIVLLVLVQDDGKNGMGLMGGRGTAAFGSHSASVLSKTTGVLVVLFFVISIGLAKINAPSGKPPKDSQTETQATTTVEEGGSLADDEAASASN